MLHVLLARFRRIRSRRVSIFLLIRIRNISVVAWLSSLQVVMLWDFFKETIRTTPNRAFRYPRFSTNQGVCIVLTGAEFRERDLCKIFVVKELFVPCEDIHVEAGT